MAELPRCCKRRCCRPAWGGTPFCFDHLIDQLHASLTEEQFGQLQTRLASVLGTLSYREREIIKLRYALGDGYMYTQAEVGRIFKISASRVCEIEQKALKKLRHPVRFEQLQDFIEVYSFDDPQIEFVRVLKLCERDIIRYLARHPTDLHSVPSRVFEEIIAEIMASNGFEVQLTQKTRDGGRDIIAVSSNRLGIPTSYIVECKRYAPSRPIRVEMVRSLYGVKQGQPADHAILATTSYFTRDAIRYSKQPHVLNLHLKDFQAITEWLRVYDEQMQKGAILL